MTFFFNDTPTSAIYTLSLHDALPISFCTAGRSSPIRAAMIARTTSSSTRVNPPRRVGSSCRVMGAYSGGAFCGRSEEHTSELQSHSDLVCRLLLEKKKN